uniref:2-oxoglutarate dehydrogenase, mitochondrial n=1 Tax=Ixodes ricinus TaxID=34613 RepID=A0A0K8RIE9_IXORI
MDRARTLMSTLTPITRAALAQTPSGTAVVRPLKGRFGFDLDASLMPVRKYVTRAAAEPFLSGSSSVYVEEMYKAWTKDPSSVHKSWDVFFRGASSGLPPGEAYRSPPSLYMAPGAAPAPARVTSAALTAPAVVPAALPSAQAAPRDIDDHLSVQAIIRSYQVRGHLAAKLDPLGIVTASANSPLRLV